MGWKREEERSGKGGMGGKAASKDGFLPIGLVGVLGALWVCWTRGRTGDAQGTHSGCTGTRHRYQAQSTGGTRSVTQGTHQATQKVTFNKVQDGVSAGQALNSWQTTPTMGHFQWGAARGAASGPLVQHWPATAPVRRLAGCAISQCSLPVDCQKKGTSRYTPEVPPLAPGTLQASPGTTTSTKHKLHNPSRYTPTRHG